MTQLSPAAQAIKNVVLALDPDRRTFKWVWSLCRPIAAAAIRELADQVVCADPTGAPDCCITTMERIRADILAIATELEAL
jgi:hypothetical protein